MIVRAPHWKRKREPEPRRLDPSMLPELDKTPTSRDGFTHPPIATLCALWINNEVDEYVYMKNPARQRVSKKGCPYVQGCTETASGFPFFLLISARLTRVAVANKRAIELERISSS